MAIPIENQKEVKEFFCKFLTDGAASSYLNYLRNAAADSGRAEVSSKYFFPSEEIIDELIARSDDKRRLNNSLSAIRLYTKFLQENSQYVEKVDDSVLLAWKNYFKAFKEISNLLGGQSNVVGTIAEKLAAEYYNAEMLVNSTAGVDLNGKDDLLYQVKARMVAPSKKTGAPLSAFRNNAEKEKIEYHFLIVVLFNKDDGSILQVLEYNLNTIDISPHKKVNKYQNAEIINFSKKFEALGVDITSTFKKKVNWL